MEFVGLPEKQGGRVEDGSGENETDRGEVMSERNEFNDQPSVDDAQEDRSCHIRVKNQRIESVFYWWIRLGWRRR